MRAYGGSVDGDGTLRLGLLGESNPEGAIGHWTGDHDEAVAEWRREQEEARADAIFGTNVLEHVQPPPVPEDPAKLVEPGVLRGGVATAAAVSLPGLGSLTACTTQSRTPTGAEQNAANSRVRLPTFVPHRGAEPDLAATADGGLAGYLDLIEINSTFYGPPAAEHARRWVEVVEPFEELGEYGGSWRGNTVGPSDLQRFDKSVSYECLVRWDEWAKTFDDSDDPMPPVIPNIAADYEASDDFRTFTFHLRPGAVFWDGVPVRARDVADAWAANAAEARRTSDAFARLTAEVPSLGVSILISPMDPLLPQLLHLVDPGYVEAVLEPLVERRLGAAGRWRDAPCRGC
jgi:hypothetical protein